MKKIDLHIHTIPATGKDANFEFDISRFQEYTDQLAIDAVAITNHNLFDLEQYKKILSTLTNVQVFPGIEIDLENGHLLLIDGNSDLEDFDQKCKLINQEYRLSEKITADKLKEIFSDLGKYLLIPHYDKKPKVDQEVIDSLNKFIFAGEVQSPKKFNRVVKEPDSLTPVLFSDARIDKDLDTKKIQGRQTYINTNASPLSVDAIKGALKDRSKVFLSNSGKHGFFQIFTNGQELSNGLNVILGGRSSGKTFLLDQLENNFDTGEKFVKYIKQFDLVKEDEKAFNEMLENEKSTIREQYLQEFKLVVEDVTNFDRRITDHKLGKYIESLLEYANSEKLHDEFSNAKLFTEIPFHIRRDKTLEEVIRAVKYLQVSTTYSSTIWKYISRDDLGMLCSELEKVFREKTETKLKKEWVNELVSEISRLLKSRSSSPSIEYNDVDFYKIKIEKESIKRFNAIANSLKNERVISENKSFGKFKIQAIAGKYTGAGELRDESRRVVSFSPAYKKYHSPIEFLEVLKNIGQLERTELYKYFCKVTYLVLNEFNRKVSGGERAEFNLLKALQDARQYEMLLVDEPESSFDNPFLNNNVNKIIKEISKELPVVVVTHNNTVGMLMHPDYILYTQREIVDGRDEYYIYSGSPGDKAFKTPDGSKAISSHSTLLSALEAGEKPYSARKELYDNYK